MSQPEIGKILVPVKRVIDPCVAIRVKADGSGVETAGVRMSMNPFDEIAVEAAVRLKESGVVNEVVAVSCGASSTGETLRTALAMGADRAVLVEAEADSPLTVARLLEAVCLREQPSLVICGKQAIDDEAGQVGPMLAALLGWPQVARISGLSVSGGQAVATCETEEGREVWRVALPAVLTTELGLNEPRYVTLANLMKAKKKALDTITPLDLGVDVVSRLIPLSTKAPPLRRAGVRVADTAELVARLRDEARVI